MKICMILYDPQEAGGLEEYATILAIGLQELGHRVSVVSATWTPPDNQYAARLRDKRIPFVQPPRWLSRAGSHWPTKERILDRSLAICSPIIALLGAVHALISRQPWGPARRSARNWVRAQFTRHAVGRDRRPELGRLVLAWWRLRWQPDVFHVQGYTSTLLFAVEWACARSVPVVYEEHQTPDARFDWWAGFSETVNKAAAVIAVSEESKRALESVCGVTRPIVTRSPLLPDPMASGWHRPRRHPGSESIRLTTVARLTETKGLEYLVDAIPLVRTAHPAAEFKVYGSGPLLDGLLARCARLGLDGRHIFVGAFTSRDELARIMADTDIFAMSSILEGQPLGLVEAMAYQCPIVTTAVGGIPELIQDGVNGLLCAPRDTQSFARALNVLIEDEPLRTRLGLAARRTYEQSPFQPASVCAHLLSVYESVLARHRPVSRP